MVPKRSLILWFQNNARFMVPKQRQVHGILRGLERSFNEALRFLYGPLGVLPALFRGP